MALVGSEAGGEKSGSGSEFVDDRVGSRWLAEGCSGVISPDIAQPFDLDRKFGRATIR
jgi:hypothetical protein